MGSTWTVEVWGDWREDNFSYVTAWQGESLIGALWALWKYRNEGTGCVTLSYRRARRV